MYKQASIGWLWHQLWFFVLFTRLKFFSFLPLPLVPPPSLPLWMRRDVHREWPWTTTRTGSHEMFTLIIFHKFTLFAPVLEKEMNFGLCMRQVVRKLMYEAISIIHIHCGCVFNYKDSITWSKWYRLLVLFILYTELKRRLSGGFYFSNPKLSPGQGCVRICLPYGPNKTLSLKPILRWVMVVHEIVIHWWF